MTSIVLDYENKQIAVDSRISKGGGSYRDDYNKIHIRGNSIFILSGSTCDFDYFIDNFELYKKIDIDAELDCYGIMIESGVAYSVFMTDGIFNVDRILGNECAGSGGAYALSALDFGKSAKEAIEYAMTKDCFTGGKVHVYDIKKGELLD